MTFRVTTCDGRWRATMTEFARFGDPARFEIAVRWSRDAEPRARRPADSWLVDGRSRRDHRRRRLSHARVAAQRRRRTSAGISRRSSSGWRPIGRTCCTKRRSPGPRKPTRSPSSLAIARSIAGSRTAIQTGGDRYRATQDWYRRHALREAAEGGLFPDLFIRRFERRHRAVLVCDAAVFRADGFQFVVEPGHARLPVADVGDPLWEALQWVASQPPSALDERDQRAWRSLCDKINSITRLTDFDLDSSVCRPQDPGGSPRSSRSHRTTRSRNRGASTARAPLSRLSLRQSQCSAASIRILAPSTSMRCAKCWRERRAATTANSCGGSSTKPTAARPASLTRRGMVSQRCFLRISGCRGESDWVDIREVARAARNRRHRGSTADRQHTRRRARGRGFRANNSRQPFERLTISTRTVSGSPSRTNSATS